MKGRLVAENWGTTTLGDCALIARRLLRPRALVVGPELGKYEEEFARAVGVDHAVTFASGRVALYAILKALDVGSPDEVLLQAPTHIVVPNAIRYTGARPVFVDCSVDDYNMDLAAAAERVTDRTRVLLLQHTFGIPVDLSAASSFAEAHDLVMIEDCVHALGARYDGRAVGSIGRAGFFSTEETKTISSTMGGVAVTDDPVVAAGLRKVQEQCAVPSRSLVARYLIKQIIYHLFTHPRIHRFTRPIYMALRRRLGNGIAPATVTEEMLGQRPDGYEMRFSNGQAAVARRQLARLESNLAHRRSVAEKYQRALSRMGFPTPQPAPGAEPAYLRFPTRVAGRDAAMKLAAERAVLGLWFTSILEEASSPSAGGYTPGDCPNAELVARQLVNLPTHPRVADHDVAALMGLFERIQPALPPDLAAG